MKSILSILSILLLAVQACAATTQPTAPPNSVDSDAIASGAVVLTTKVTGILPVANGGTNSSTALSSNRLIISSGGAIGEAAAMTDGQVVVGKTGNAPQLVALSGDATVNNTGAMTIANDAITLAKLAAAARPTQNVLINGSFAVSQRGGTAEYTSASDGAYTIDRWVVLCSSAPDAIGVTQVAAADTTSNAQYAVKVRNYNGPGDSKFAIMQPIEAANSIPLRGRPVTASARVKTTSAGLYVRIGIIEWTGTADTIAFGGTTNVDPIGTWANANEATPAAGSFFLNTSLTVCAYSAASTAPGTDWTTLSCTGTVSANATNLCVIIWAASNMTKQTEYLYVNAAGLYDGASARDWIPRLVADEVALCQRYYQVYGGTSNTPPTGYGYASAASQAIVHVIVFPVTMRKAPTAVLAGTWAVSNCGQPVLATGSAKGIMVYADSTGAGYTYWTPNSTDDLVTLDAELN